MSVLFLWTVLVYACNPSLVGKNEKKIPLLVRDSVDWIKVKGISADTTRLNLDQTSAFVNRFNQAKAAGLYKFISKQHVLVRMLDGSERQFRINGALIKESGDQCMRAETEFFKGE